MFSVFTHLVPEASEEEFYLHCVYLTDIKHTLVCTLTTLICSLVNPDDVKQRSLVIQLEEKPI